MVHLRSQLERLALQELLRWSIPTSLAPQQRYQQQHFKYGPHPRQHLYLLTPDKDPPPKGWPLICFIHGGGFTSGSAQGYLPLLKAFDLPDWAWVSIGYRLTPEHPFPTPLLDVLAACSWLAQHCSRHQIHPQQWMVAGDSAGANLALAAYLASRHAKLWQHNPTDASALWPCQGLLLFYGFLQVSLPKRLLHTQPQANPLAYHYLQQFHQRYCPPHQMLQQHMLIPELCDPLCLLERDPTLAKSLPPMWIGCGSLDPLLDDSLRLFRSLPDKVRDQTQLHVYPEALHGFLHLQSRTYLPQVRQQLAQFCQPSVSPQITTSSHH